MLTIDEQLFDIDEAIDEVAASFLELESVKNYRKAREVFLADTVLQEKIMHFQALKQSYEDVKSYAAFRSEVAEIRRQLFKEKRGIDINEKVSQLRQSEVAVQKNLAKLSQKISSTISSDIFVETGLPLAPHKSHYGNCSKGGRKKHV